MTFDRRARGIAATVLATLSLAIASPASARLVKVDDPADVAGASLNDIRRVKVQHADPALFVKVRFTELKHSSDAGPSSLSVFVDTKRKVPGPEFRLATGLQAGTDYQLVRMKDWKPVGDPLTCRHVLALDFAENFVKAHVARPCLGNPDYVRVGVKMVDLYDGSHPVVDWLKKPRGWTRWLVVG